MTPMRLLDRTRWRIATQQRTNRSARIDTPRVLARGLRLRVAILSASVGSGHVRAASAVESALSCLLPDSTIAHIDVLQLTNSLFRRAYADGYYRAVRCVPRLVGMMYDILDRPADRGPASRARLAFERLILKRLEHLLIDQPWDLAISTHFLPPGVVGWLRSAGRIQFPHATVITDFGVHGRGIKRHSDCYFVATDEARAGVIASGIDGGRIEATGIPIDPLFSRPIDLGACLSRNGLLPHRPTVLQ